MEDALFVFAIPGVVLGIIAFFLPDYKTVKSQTATSFRSVLADTVDLWRIPSLKWLFLGYGMHCLMGFSLMAWGPAMLMRTFKIPEATAGMIMGILGMFSIVGALLGGWLADAWYKAEQSWQDAPCRNLRSGISHSGYSVRSGGYVRSGGESLYRCPIPM
ncbi:MAG: hypothetical protein MZV70_03125 [Desulfobacterales bacterium]|nr:hypothetical protein [Desulfobacterales bacterium]